ncbi:beta strand repeat-containing protein [Pannonibacter phragmitetus]|uniref:beta strand repeat-containing protein n=1 Tax=Pannonibacter phragmitetus TaxID=121719 RepID=UPI003D2EBCF7
MHLVTGSKLAGNGLPRLEWAGPQRAEFRPGTQVENIITTVGRFSPLSILSRLCLFLCLALTALLVTATRSEAALSAACQAVNDEWRSGKTITIGDIPSGGSFQFVSEHDTFNNGESLSWFATGTSDPSGNTSAKYEVGSFDDTSWIGTANTTDNGSFTSSGTRTLASSDTVYIQIDVQRNNTNLTTGASTTLRVSCTEGPPVTLSPGSGALPAGQESVSYSQSVTASGGAGGYSYAVSGGSLPAGLSLNTGTGEISGTPSTAGTANFTITATDAGSSFGSASYSLQINAAPVTITLSPAAGALTAGQVGTAYSQSVSASGGTGPYTYALTGSLPAGLSLNTSTGEISGTPTTVENPNFTITATDANNATGNAAYSLQINAAPVTITLSPAAGALTAGQVGTAYSQSVSASGGTGPYTYALTGSLPAGLSLNTSTGEISGTPTTVENPNFTITATDANNATGDAAYSLQINAAPVTITLAPAAGALTAGQVGTAYSQSVSASGGTGPYTYALTGSLPAGLSLNTSTGEISGTPTTVENPNFTITATDANNATGNAAYSLQINAAPVTITLSPAAGALTAGQVGTAYSQSVSASGGTGPYTYALTGSLPAGLSLNTSTGEISGTPTTVENPNFTITATDANNATGDAAYSLQINAAPVTITLAPAAGALTAGQVGTAYSQSVSASGGTGPYTYALTGSLPAGLSLNTSTGEISGTPTTVENPNFTITATDANNATGDAAYSLQINAAPVTITLAPAAGALTAGQVGTAYSQSVSASGGTGPYTYALTGSLPAGLSLNTSTGEISGTPTTVENPNFTITATDANNATGNAAYSLQINAAPVTITLAPAAGALTAGQVGTAYSQSVSASGGTGPYTYALTGSLPAGLSLNTSTGEISGTPTTVENPNFTITATDANNATGDAAYSLQINAAPVTITLSPAAGALTAGQVGTAYSQSVSASGGTGPYTYALTGSLPAGLSLNTSTGEISGTPTTVENPNFTITATDANNATGNAAYSLQINAAPVTITLSPAAGALTAGQVGTAYSQSVSASGGTGPYTYALTGSLPAGLSLNTSTGEISGTPTTVENPNFTITATDANNATGNAAYSLQINAAPVTITLSPAAGALTAGQVGTAYSQSVSASGGTGPYTYAVTGSLPAGLSLNTNTGEISGTPTTAGTATFTVTATDANTNTGDAAYSLNVNAAPASISFEPAGGALPEAMAGEEYTTTIAVSGGSGPYLFSISAGALPPGMVLNVSTGALNGPLNTGTEGSYSFTIQVSDANNAVASAAYTLEVKKRAVTVTDKVVTVPAGSTPTNVNLATGATGGPFIDANIVSVEPANAGTARIVNSQFAQAGGVSGSAGYYLKFTPDPAYSGQVTIRFSLTSELRISNTGSVIYNLGYNPQKVAAEIDSLVRGFVRTRQGLIANSVKVPGLRDRRRMQTANEIVSMRFTPRSVVYPLDLPQALNRCAQPATH